MKKQKLPILVVIAIFSLVTALVWAFSDVLRSLTKSPEIEVAENVLEPLDPTLDSDTLNRIQNATYFEEGQVTQIFEQTSPTPEAIPDQTPTVTPPGTASPQATSTPGGVTP